MKLCTICLSDSRAQADAALAANLSTREIAELLGTSLNAVRFHRRHLPHLLEKEGTNGSANDEGKSVFVYAPTINNHYGCSLCEARLAEGADENGSSREPAEDLTSSVRDIEVAVEEGGGGVG
jgi:hypothetical protein